MIIFLTIMWLSAMYLQIQNARETVRIKMVIVGLHDKIQEVSRKSLS